MYPSQIAKQKKSKNITIINIGIINTNKIFKKLPEVKIPTSSFFEFDEFKVLFVFGPACSSWERTCRCRAHQSVWVVAWVLQVRHLPLVPLGFRPPRRTKCAEHRRAQHSLSPHVCDGEETKRRRQKKKVRAGEVRRVPAAFACLHLRVTAARLAPRSISSSESLTVTSREWR